MMMISDCAELFPGEADKYTLGMPACMGRFQPGASFDTVLVFCFKLCVLPTRVVCNMGRLTAQEFMTFVCPCITRRSKGQEILSFFTGTYDAESRLPT